MKTRTEEEMRAKIIEITELQNWLLEVMDTKATYRERQKVRQAVTSTMSFIDGLRYSLGEIDNDYWKAYKINFVSRSHYHDNGKPSA